MTKKELLKALESYADDDLVYVSLFDPDVLPEEANWNALQIQGVRDGRGRLPSLVVHRNNARLPLESKMKLLDGAEEESEEQWMLRIAPQCRAIYDAIQEAKKKDFALKEVVLNPCDAESLKRNGEMPDRIWGFPLVLDSSVPLGVTATRIQ